jgi:ribonuclease HI
MTRVAVVHLDESCLGNGRDGDNPGGAGGLAELRHKSAVERRDLWLSDRATTNNRMALEGAAAMLEQLGAKGHRLHVLIVSDSEYLVKGIREWVPSWRARGWVRKGGAIENLDRWKRLVAAAALHDVQFTWVRGHKGHPKNEYANDLAIAAATSLTASDGLVPSGFAAWLDRHRAKGTYRDYDPDAAFTRLEERLLAGERFALRGEA